MAQRSSGTGTRARSRSQPYNSTLIPSASRPQAPYLNALVPTISTSPPHSTHPTVHHTHLPPDVIGSLGPVGNRAGKAGTRPTTRNKVAARTTGE